MEINVTGRHVEVTSALRQHIQDKLEKIIKHPYKFQETQVTLTVEKYRHIAEIILQVDRLVLRSKEETNDMYTSFDLALDKIKQQLRRNKEKYYSSRTKNSLKRYQLEGDRSPSEDEEDEQASVDYNPAG